MTTDRAGGDRDARERQVHASVVIVSALVWVASAGVVLHEMRQDAPPPMSAAAVPLPPPTPLNAAPVASAPPPRTATRAPATARAPRAVAGSPGADATTGGPGTVRGANVVAGSAGADATLTDATLAAGDLRPAPPRRKVVVVRRSRAS